MACSQSGCRCRLALPATDMHTAQEASGVALSAPQHAVAILPPLLVSSSRRTQALNLLTDDNGRRTQACAWDQYVISSSVVQQARAEG